jgi:riboflavin kinase / FMN adenylyltransferase
VNILQTIYLEHPHHIKRDDQPKTVLALGYFDGVHKGHQQVILTAKYLAKEKGYKSGVMTFHPHPSVVLNKKVKHVQYITPLEDKLKEIEKLGIDFVYVVKFTEEFSKLEPQEFVDNFIIGLNVKHVVAGFDFSFGRMGKGNMELMPKISRGEYTTTTVSKVSKDGEKISSTLIRQNLQEGKMKEVKDLLGRPYAMKGVVVHGNKRGRELGYPTANLQLKEPYYIPKIGIYAVGVMVDNQSYYGMASIGYNPTFDEKELKIEVNIFDFSGNIYGKEIVLELYDYVRNEEKFASLDELVDKLKQDEEQIRQFFASSLI